MGINPFLNAVFYNDMPISSRLKDVRQALGASPGYTLVVPKTSVLEWCVDRETLLPLRDLCAQDDFIGSHIIQVPPTLRNHQRARYFGTANAKTVIIKDGYIYTHKGFKTLVRAQITKEYIFYPACVFLPVDAQFVVYEVDVPLIGIPAPSMEVSPTISSKYQLVPSSSTKGTHDGATQRKDLERLLSAYPSLSRQVLGPLMALIEDFDCSEAASEAELLSMFETVIGSGIHIFQNSDTAVISTLAHDNQLTGEDIAGTIYQYVEANVSDKLWPKLIEMREEADNRICEAIDGIKHVDIGQIGLPEELGIKQLFALDKLVWQATSEVRRLADVTSAEDKIEVLMSVLHILGNSTAGQLNGTLNTRMTTGTNGPTAAAVAAAAAAATYRTSVTDGTHVNADVLVSLMLLVVVRSGLKSLDSELFYIRNFTHRDSESGELGYALLTLEGVLYHIVNDSSKIVPLAKHNHELWELVKDGNVEDLEKYLQRLTTEFDDWISVVRSRSPLGESSLMCAIQNKNIPALRTILNLKDALPGLYILNDTTESGKSLLVTAVQSEQKEVVVEILRLIQTFDEEEQRQYFAVTDNWNRAVGHYFFHAPWLIKEIGHLISWEQKDQNGQTPLFALCRTYDHANYGELLELGFRSWSNGLLRQGHTPSILQHVDNKGNTLLHIVKDEAAVERVLEYDVDVNWPNERGLTPLMVYSKYSRLTAITVLCRDKRVDLERTDSRGLNALDLAKDAETLALLDGKQKSSVDAFYSSLTNPRNSFIFTETNRWTMRDHFQGGVFQQRTVLCAQVRCPFGPVRYFHGEKDVG
jgi:hypothetical protein